jgi:hypothetical protein
LLEVLAALALASLILVSLNLAMRSIGMGVDRTRQSLSQQQAIAAAVELFGRDVARIAKIRRPGGEDFEGYVFDGQPNEMVYVLREERGITAPELYLVRLSLRDSNGVGELVRERAPLPFGGAGLGAPEWRDPVVLLSGPYDIGFAYRAQRSGIREWSSRWSVARQMPEQIRLTIADAGTGELRVPGFVQSLAIDAEADCVTETKPPCGEAAPEGQTQ